jgi:hypothetical protein
VEICYIPWAKSFFWFFFGLGFLGLGFLDFWFLGLGEIFDGERNCGGWGKLWFFLIEGDFDILKII